MNRHFAENRHADLGCDLVDVAFAENGQLFAAVRTYEVAVVLYDTEHRNAHHLCHLVGFHDDHAHQILRGRYDHYAVYRKRLENGQRNITGSWRHVDEEIVQVAPDDVGPELFYGSCDDRSSPDDRLFLARKQEVDGHYLYAVCCNCRVNALVIYVCRSFQAIHFRDGRSCDIGIEDTNLVALFCFLVCQRCGYHGFTNTALAADNANDMFDRRIGIQINMKIRFALSCFAWTSFAAFFGTARIAAFFCHVSFLFSCFSCLFDKAVDRLIQLLNRFCVPMLDCIDDAMFNVILQDNFSCIVNGRLHGRQLDQNLSAVPAFLYHPLDRLHVSDRAGEAV